MLWVNDPKKIWVMTRLRSWPDWVMTKKINWAMTVAQLVIKFLNTNYIFLGIRSWPELESWPKFFDWVMTHNTRPKCIQKRVCMLHTNTNNTKHSCVKPVNEHKIQEKPQNIPKKLSSLKKFLFFVYFSCFLCSLAVFTHEFFVFYVFVFVCNIHTRTRNTNLSVCRCL